MIHLEPLGPQHAEQILSGQDDLLAAEVFGVHWQPGALGAFLARAVRWRPDGPLREYAAVRDVEGEGHAVDELVGGGGLHLLGAGLEHGQAALTYWVLEEHRGQGLGRAISAALVDLARADGRIRELVLRISPSNTASAAVARSLGATPTGRSERHPADGTRVVDRWTLRLH